MSGLKDLFDPGDEVVTIFTVTDANGDLFDPPTVKWHYRKEGSRRVTQTSGVDPAATRESLGVYKHVLSIPYSNTSAGKWYLDAQALDNDDKSVLVSFREWTVRSLGTL